MGEKVNYSKNKNNKLKLIIIILLILVSIIILIRSIKSVRKEMIQEAQPTDSSATIYKSVKEYNTLEDLMKSFRCNVISKEETNEFVKVKLTFDVGLYTENVSNETHFLNICKAVAEFIDYKNFELIDTQKDIDIEVKCEKPNITELIINGDSNYYLNNNSKRNRSLSSSVTNFIVQSAELQELINGDWNEAKVNWGERDSICNSYNIYFDEGIRYKTVATDVFNVVFTEKYNKQVVGGLNANSSVTAVETALGTPNFSKNDEIYGYVSDTNYVFFDFVNHEISVYPVINVSSKEENELKELINQMNESSDIKAFATELTRMWNDYDVYDYDSNYVDLRYTLRGVKLDISSASLKNGIFIYQNYSGNIDIANLENVYLTNTDMVFVEEKERSMDEYLKRHIEGELSEEEKKSFGINFGLRFLDADEEGYRGPIFYSRTGEFSDSELDKNLQLSSYKWYDDSKLVYSVNYDGIYVYNCETRVNAKLIDLDKEIIITSAGDGQIIYNNNEVVNVEIN